MSINAFGIVDRFVESNFYDRFYGKFSESDISDDGRLPKKLNYLKYMLDYPLGGGNIRKITGYAHDIVLDTYDEAGVFALLAILILLFSDALKCLRMYRNISLCGDTKILFLTVFLLIILQFMLEPILLGTQWLMACYCVISGALSRMTKG